jgi:hypothetical protein
MAIHTEKTDDALDPKDAAPRATGSRDTESSLVELGMEFALALRAKGNPSKGVPADKEFIDSLYEGESGDFSLTDIERA